MQLLVITNLFPPQELGGYGRAMADFVWALEQRGHQLTVLCSDAPYLIATDPSTSVKAAVERTLQLKGSFDRGVQHLTDQGAKARIDEQNRQTIAECLAAGCWDGVLLGNLDLLGPELLRPLLTSELPLLHHIGYTNPPFAPGKHPSNPCYQLLAASKAVRNSLVSQGLPVQHAPIVYPGARCDLFGPDATGRLLPAPLGTPDFQRPLGSESCPLKVCFAGLMMSSKGPHTLAEALLLLKHQGLAVRLSFAGGRFQPDYMERIQEFLQDHHLQDQVEWFGQLSRSQLARYFALHHVLVFPSLHPEAFGIVAAEAMASGLLLVSSGVGGASELFEDGVSGLRFTPGNAEQLAAVLSSLCLRSPRELRSMAKRGQRRVLERFSVGQAAAQIEAEFLRLSPDEPELTSSPNRARNLGQTTF